MKNVVNNILKTTLALAMHRHDLNICWRGTDVANNGKCL